MLNYVFLLLASVANYTQELMLSFVSLIEVCLPISTVLALCFLLSSPLRKLGWK